MKRGDVDLGLMSAFQIDVIIKLLSFLYIRNLRPYMKQIEIKEPMINGEQCYIALFLSEVQLELDIYHNELGYVFGDEEGAMFERIHGETDNSISNEFFKFLDKEFKNRNIV